MEFEPQNSPWVEILSRAAVEGRPWLIVPRAPALNSEHRVVSYTELQDGATRVSSFLHRQGVNTGDRVALIADSSVESCILVLGILISGAVLVPIAPPGMWQRTGPWENALARVSVECAPRLLLVAENRTLKGVSLPPQLRVHEFNDVASERADNAMPELSVDRSALIQYTSGTTAVPRGVELTHGNLVHCVRSIGQSIEVGPHDIGATWLPMFHDMGLIGSLLFCFYWRIPIVLCTPRSFALRPESWLWAISRFGATCSAAPNSAYHACAQKVQESRLRGLDLRRWRVSFNGAELVHAETIDRFTRRFATYGYRSDAMYPVYGLAENTLAATLPRYRDPLRVDVVAQAALEQEGRARHCNPNGEAERALVAVGRSIAGQVMRIVDPDTWRHCGNREVGEIQLRGACTMRGYYRRARKEAFTADGWLRTGDRGYIADGDLFLTGRYKHVIKRGGRTFDSAFIENALRTVTGIRGGNVAVFGLPDTEQGTERLIVMAETIQTTMLGRQSLSDEIAFAMRAGSLPVADLIELVPPGTIPRTSSGKIRHADALAIYRARRE